MKRFLTLFLFLMLLLSGHVSYAQDKAQPPADTSPPVMADDGNKVAETAPQNTNEKTTNQDERPVSVNSTIDERMANIAQESNEWAMGQTIIGGIGLIFVIAATVFAGLAWRAAKVGADIGRETLDETIIANERAQRAWLAINKTPHGIISRFTVEGASDVYPDALFVKVQLKNVGMTPAISVRMEVEKKIVPRGHIPSFETKMQTSKATGSFVPQSGFCTSGRIVFYGDDLEAFRTKTHDAYIFTRCEYQTLFDKKIKFTRELLQIIAEGSHQVNGVDTPLFKFLTITEHNCNT